MILLALNQSDRTTLLRDQSFKVVLGPIGRSLVDIDDLIVEILLFNDGVEVLLDRIDVILR